MATLAEAPDDIGFNYKLNYKLIVGNKQFSAVTIGFG